MTTKVLIVNHGPDYVLVRTFPKDCEPGEGMHFTASVGLRARPTDPTTASRK